MGSVPFAGRRWSAALKIHRRGPFCDFDEMPIRYIYGPFSIRSMHMENNTASDRRVLRIIDVNLNRLREALRVIEEYFRFFELDERVAAALKRHRHSLEEIEADVGAAGLVASRDIGTDPFAYVNKPEELGRPTPHLLLAANFKRSQEAARVIEEYAKLAGRASVSEKAKALRFTLYDLEKDAAEHGAHG